MYAIQIFEKSGQGKIIASESERFPIEQILRDIVGWEKEPGYMFESQEDLDKAVETARVQDEKVSAYKAVFDAE